jgi:hypothetical protein
MPRLILATETPHPSNSALYTNDVNSSAELVTPVNSGAFRQCHQDSIKLSKEFVRTQNLLHGSVNVNVIDPMIAASKSLKAGCSSGPQMCSIDTAAAAFFALRFLPSNTFASAA